MVQKEANHWNIPEENSLVISLSQEHGIIKASSTLFEKTQIGDLLYILPIHSCMAANLMDHYLSLDGNQISRL